MLKAKKSVLKKIQIFPSQILLDISSFTVLMRVVRYQDHLRLKNKGYSQVSNGRWVEEAESQRVLGGVAAVQCSITNPCFQEKKGPHCLNLCDAKPSLILTEIAKEGRIRVQSTS